MFIQLIPSIKTNSTHFKITIDVLTKLNAYKIKRAQVAAPGGLPFQTGMQELEIL